MIVMSKARKHAGATTGNCPARAASLFCQALPSRFPYIP
jgi:hypothetical protein